MSRILRCQQILKYLNANEYLFVDEAVKLLDSSAPTIRRDFNYLAQNKLAERFRGGLKRIKLAPGQMVPFVVRQFQQSTEKHLIAQEAVKLIRSGYIIFIDGGTTTFHLAMYLPNIQLRVITNSLRLANILEEKSEEYPNLEISLTGGLLYKKSGILLGPNTESSVAQYHADFAFLSVGGIDDEGIYNTNELVSGTERVMIQNANKVVVLADHSKLGRKAMCRVCGLDKIHILITNYYPPHRNFLNKIKNAGIHVIETPSSGQSKIGNE